MSSAQTKNATAQIENRISTNAHSFLTAATLPPPASRFKLDTAKHCQVASGQQSPPSTRNREVRVLADEAESAEAPRPPLVLTPPAPKPSPAAEWRAAFDDDFWPAYPRHRGCSKLLARRAWDRIRPQTQATFDALMDGLDRWRAFWDERGTEEQYIPHPATWLNQRRWEDEA